MALRTSRKRLRPALLAATAAVLMFSSMLQALNVSSKPNNDLPSSSSSSLPPPPTRPTSSPAGDPATTTCPSLSGATSSETDGRGGKGGAARTAHLVVLVHGWMGNPLELGYLLQSMTSQAHESLVDPDGNIALVVRSSQVNDGRTSDGIKAGGERLATEVSTWIDELLKSPDGIEKVSLSFVGNSLGGLYARYAIGVPALLDLDRVEPKLFCTTATPHLGVSDHTYVALPKFAEGWVAAAIGSTGYDLFRRNDTLERMTEGSSSFVAGLRRFRKRIAYANAHYTDFQVPSATAAFVVPDLESPHVRIRSPEPPPPDFVAIAVETPITQLDPSPSASDPRDGASMRAREMARRLDGLGWTKVFVDLRPHLVSVPLPFARSSSSSDALDERDRYTSSELHDRFCRVTDRLHFPLGHTVLVANSKNSFYRLLNAAGKPVVDRVAADLLVNIIE